MKPSRRRQSALGLTVLLLLAGNAAAQTEPAAGEPVPSAATRDGTWAWVLIGASLVGGGLLAAHGLSQECGTDQPCTIRASLALWGGIGIAGTGSMIGFTVLQAVDEEDVNARPVWVLGVGGAF